MLVINVHTLSEVALGVVRRFVTREVRVKSHTIVLLLLAHSVRQATRRRLLAVHNLHQGASRVLTGEVAKNDGADVGVVVPVIDETDTSGVDDDVGVGALVRDGGDEMVGVGVGEVLSVPGLGGLGVDEDDAVVACAVDGGLRGLDVPGQHSAIFVGLALEGIKRSVDIP